MRRSVTPAVTAAAVLALLAGGAAVRLRGGDSAGPAGGSRRLPPLMLPARAGEADASVALGAPNGISKGAGSGKYVLKGTLPATPSGDVQAYRLPWRAATKDQAARVAAALHMAGTPTRMPGGWSVVADGRTLHVTDGPGTPWSMYAGDATCAVDSKPGVAEPAPPAPDPDHPTPPVKSAPVVVPAEPEPATISPDRPGRTRGGQPELIPALPPACGGGAGGVVSSGSAGASATSKPPQPTTDAAATVARELLAALGTGRDAVLTMTDGWVGRTVVATHTIDGLTGSGWQTYVTVDAQRRVIGGSGFLGEPVKAGAFPVISARAAFDALPPMPAILMCARFRPGPGCGPVQDVVVTGASVGLLLVPSYDARSDSYLLPAWIFAVAGDLPGIPVVAVPEQFLAPEPTPGKPAVPTGGVPPAGTTGCAPDDVPVASDGSTGVSPQCDPGTTGDSEPGSSGGG
jgi:hypothetical protein